MLDRALSDAHFQVAISWLEQANAIKRAFYCPTRRYLKAKALGHEKQRKW